MLDRSATKPRCGILKLWDDTDEPACGDVGLIHVQIVLFGRLALKFGKALSSEVDEDISLGDFTRWFFRERGLGEIRFRGSSLETRQGFLKVILNGREVALDTPLKNGDKVSLVPVVSGG